MNRSLPVALLAGAALFSATAGLAATTPKPAARTIATTRMTTTKRTSKPRMVSAKLANGKMVTYNCSLPGNAAKQACR